jgi:CheY-like chemotaxis protein
MQRRHHDRRIRAGRREGDGRTPVAEYRRVLLVGPDEAWRLLTAYIFEDAGYTVYAAADYRQAVAFTTRLLPDVVVVAIDTPETLEILMRLSTESATHDIPIVMLTTSLHSSDARCTREAGVHLVAVAPHEDVSMDSPRPQCHALVCHVRHADTCNGCVTRKRAVAWHQPEGQDP